MEVSGGKVAIKYNKFFQKIDAITNDTSKLSRIFQVTIC
tara:strand:- start:490 stop:606 length:117 start_codon:yes stop_codon:yes gene_type:complete